MGFNRMNNTWSDLFSLHIFFSYCPIVGVYIVFYLEIGKKEQHTLFKVALQSLCTQLLPGISSCVDQPYSMMISSSSEESARDSQEAGSTIHPQSNVQLSFRHLDYPPDNALSRQTLVPQTIVGTTERAHLREIRLASQCDDLDAICHRGHSKARRIPFHRRRDQTMRIGSGVLLVNP
jgi:hypothetical protein